MMFEFNENYRENHVVSEIPQRGDPTSWGNPNTRCMLQFLYLVSFWCLLRYDEALKIKWSDLRFVTGSESESGVPHIIVDVAFRKTHQLGGESLIRFHCSNNSFH